MLIGMDSPSARQIHVLVVVSGEPNQVAKDTRLARTHSENRRKRWRELNEILDKNKKAKRNGDDGSSTGCFYVRWSEVKSVLDYERYEQERKPIPDHAFDFLIKYLKYAAKAMNGYTDASEGAKCFIAPVLIMLCSLFVDVKLEVEASVDGNEVHATGHFEFVLTRGKTKICIVEAKKNDFNQGKVQALIGCEAVADREGLYVVYGIVTDFMEWYLYRCGENSILLDSSTLSAKSEQLDIGSMRDVCEMIYGALSDHEEECKKEKLCVE
ncbi:Crinkler effector protein 5 [Phytophthora ramorum]|uniref:Crinkler effector protein 5 n=1 Tax=Phytophthora ramorum TaxID=164328 RepID=UPI00309BE818|nr:Crinkler effector protein 5 [Phytophthora ramorum]